MATTKKSTKNSSAKKSTSTKAKTTNKKKTTTPKTTTAKKSANTKTTTKKKTSTKNTTSPKKKTQTTNKSSTKNANNKKSTKAKNSTQKKVSTTKKSTSTPKINTNNKTKTPTYNKEKQQNSNNIFIYICKQVLMLLKNLRNFIIKQYNKVRRKIASKNQENKTRGESVVIELDLLHYKDYKGFKKIKVFFINRIRVMKFDMKKFGKKFKYGTLKDKILIILMCFLIACFSLLIVFVGYVIITAPEVSEKNLYKSSATVLYDINGKEYARLGAENRDRISYDDLPQVLVDAIVATEDSRFFQHNGIDIARFTKATIGQLLGHADAGGGSTLTMQVSKNAATSRVSSGIAGIIRKFTDIYLSVFVLEKKYTKEQIIEFYVNINELGSRAFGVEQASQTYFGKSVTDLTLSEAALIAGLFQAPTAYNPFSHPEAATKRRGTVLNLMYRHGYITEEERDEADAIPVTSLLKEKGDGKLPEEIGYIDTVVTDVKEKLQALYGGEKDDWSPDNLSMNVYTTFDPERQQVINDIYSGKTYKWKNDVAQAGIAVIDVHTGALVAVGAGRNKTEQRGWNFAYTLRPPGSTAKPVLDYGPAIEYLNWGTGQTIVDDKMTYSGGASIRNFDSGYKGIMTIKKSLAQSRNIPALFTFMQTTNEQKVDFATKLGWTSLETSNGQILESASIGGFEGVSPIQSAAAFATFARGGTYIEPYTFTKIEFTDTGEVYEHTPKKVQAMSEETAYIITNILRYAVTSGTVGVGGVSGTDIAAKTGTTTVGAAAKKQLGVKSMIGDVWEVAYSPDYAVSMWYGYKTNTKEYHLTGKEGSAARRSIIKLLTKGVMKKNSRFKKPSGLTTVEIELETDPVQLASEFTPKELRSSEIFKKGSAPSQVSTRFSKLENPSNLSYNSTSNSVTLSWTPAATPEAVNTEYLTEYFKKSNVYKRWADKYLKQRLDYNNANIGVFGYEVYLKNQTGTYDLGFTTNTRFTTNVQFDATTTFIVKSSYQKFKSNQSDGISVSVAPNSSVNNIPQAPPTTTTTEQSKLSITYLGPNCSTVDDFKALGSNAKDKILVKENGVDVTNQATVSMDCFLVSDPDTGGQCNNLVSGKEYTINITVSYKKTNRSKIINLKKSC